MPISDYYIILNPAADRGRAARLGPELRRLFRATGARAELVETERRGHAGELAEAAAREGRPAVVAVGGDGVVHEVVNGLLRAAGDGPTVPLGLIAAGSGNDFIKMIGTPRRPADAVRALVAAEARAVDVGCVTCCEAERAPRGKWFFTNGIGLGFDAQVAVAASGVQRLRGMAIYAVALLRVLRHLRTPRIRVVVDGVEIADRELLLTTIGNGACHGGSFWLCPDASIEDGLFDVLISDARSVPAVLRLLPRVMRGRHLGEPGVELHRGRVVEITSDTPLPIHADGEIVGAGVRRIRAEVAPGRLTVLG
ncbi:MAG TPA: diacylglycerol kinase family protein [Longimicrobiaceae bacterium]|nr:diacylglycerol kinase family protein [Longimicrobiaceae bacterium]